MGTVVRLYLGWRLFRLLRPVLAAALVAGVLFALHNSHVPLKGSGAKTVQDGAAAATAAGRDLPRAFQTSRQ